MKKLLLVAAATLAMASANAQPAKSEKHAQGATKARQSVYNLLGTNMGPLGAMAKGKMPFDAQAAEKYATRISQLGLMMADYTRVDTSGFKVKSDALPKIWQEGDKFAAKIDDLNKAAVTLIAAAKTGNEGAIKKAIGGVGRTCGSCHDDFKAE